MGYDDSEIIANWAAANARRNEAYSKQMQSIKQQIQKDPKIQSIECSGPGKNILIKRFNKINSTRITLNQVEIANIIHTFSEHAKIIHAEAEAGWHPQGERATQTGEWRSGRLL